MIIRSVCNKAIIFILMICSAMMASGATISLSQNDLGPFGKTSSLHINGIIVENDFDQIKSLVGGMMYDPSLTLHVTLNSPGGSLYSSIRIANFLQELPITVTSNVGIANQPGTCASSCSIIYLGAAYRFLREGSLLGLHQFPTMHSDVLSVDEATSSALGFSVEILKILERANVSNEFFYEMATTPPDVIVWLDERALDELNLVNENIFSEVSELKISSGAPYVRLLQQSYFGENKLMLACLNNEMVFISYIQPADIQNFRHEGHSFWFVLNGVPMPVKEVFSEDKDERWVQTGFRLNKYQLDAISTAKTIGVRHVVDDVGVFLGFEYNLDTLALDKVIEMMKLCESNPIK